MSTIIPILDSAIKLSNEERYSGKKKTSFWASETELMAFDIYHRWIETKPTNPIEEEKLMMLKMRTLTEDAIVFFLRKTGKVIERFTNQERCYFEWGPNKVPISGYPDLGIALDGEEIIVEVKTYYGSYQHSQIRIGHIKTSYLKQLCIYLHHFKIKHGILIMINQGTGERFEYEVYQEGKSPYYYVCPDADVQIDLEAVFKRFEKIYTENVLPNKEPDIEFTYKYDIEKVDWANTPASVITKARTGKSVYGAFEVKYSDFKNIIVKKQGTCLGYSDEELKRINELTAGYSTRASNKVRFEPSELK